MRIPLLGLAAIGVLASLQSLLAANVTGAEVIDYGIFDKISIGPRKEPPVLSGQVDEVPIVWTDRVGATGRKG